jgi:hypothetical protein
MKREESEEIYMNKKTLFIILTALCITSQLSAQTTGTAGLSYTLIDGGKAYSVSKGTAAASEVVIPETYNKLPVKEIAEMGFSNYAELTSIKIPNSITKINNRAFATCRKLTNIQIPNSVTSIGYTAFRSCSSLTSITIPQGITRIERSMFESCATLTSVTLPNSVTRIGDSAFRVAEPFDKNSRQANQRLASGLNRG